MARPTLTRSPRRSGYRVAYAVFELNPLVSPQSPAQLQGLPGAPRLATRADTKFRAQMLLLEDDRASRVLLVASDVFAFEPAFADAFAEASAAWGVAPEAVLLNASHTRDGLGTTSSVLGALGTCHEGYLGHLHGTLRRAGGLLADNLVPCRIFWTHAESRLGAPRPVGGVDARPLSSPSGSGDVRTPILVVQYQTSGRFLLVVNHGCIPQRQDGSATLSAGYPAHLRAALERRPNIDAAIFLQGAAGDAIPDGAELGPLAPESPSALPAAVGEHLATRVARALDAPLNPVNGRFVAVGDRVVVQPAPLPPGPELRRLSTESASPWVRAWSSRMLEDDSPAGAAPIRLQTIGLGDTVRLLAMAGSTTSVAVARVKADRAVPEATFVLGYTNGFAASLPDDEALPAEGVARAEEAWAFPARLPAASGRMRQAFAEQASEIDRLVEAAGVPGDGDSAEPEGCPRATVDPPPDPKVSFGMFLYNAERLVDRAIDSILAQDYEDFELIIGDNCSTDGTQRKCERHAVLDRRVRYHRHSHNLGMVKNAQFVLGRSESELFVQAHWDNYFEPGFLRACLERFEQPDAEDILVVYTACRMFQHGRPTGIRRDDYRLDQDDPLERFRTIIRRFTINNMSMGVSRREPIAESTAWFTPCYRAGDHLMLAELVLKGRVVQLDQVLANRELTRQYEVGPDDRHVDLIRSVSPETMADGITLPFCRAVYAHLDMINRLSFPTDVKSDLAHEVVRTYKLRFGGPMLYEIDRAVGLIRQGRVYQTWDGQTEEQTDPRSFLGAYHASSLLSRLHEAALLFPELPQLAEAMAECRSLLGRSFGSSFPALDPVAEFAHLFAPAPPGAGPTGGR